MSSRHRGLLRVVNGHRKWRRCMWRAIRTPNYAAVSSVEWARDFLAKAKCPEIRLTSRAQRRRDIREQEEYLAAKGRAFSGKASSCNPSPAR